MNNILSVEEFACLVSSDGEESQLLIRNGHATQEVWLSIIVKRPDLVRAVTLNKHLPESVIRTLAVHADPNVRCDIAMRRALPDDLFELLASDADESVRDRIAWNKKTPIPILVKLSKDQSQLVREAVDRRFAP